MQFPFARDTDPKRRSLLGLAAAGALSGLAGPSLAASPLAAARLPPNRKSILHHRFGLNYVPSRQWYYAYNDWDPKAIRRDMADIAELGADHIRAMVVWPFFQPNPQQLSQLHLDRLDQLMEAAAAAGLDVQPCIYTGWLSGYKFAPHFYQDEPFFTSPKWAAAQALYLKALAGRMNRHRNFLGFDIGNELGCMWTTPNLAEGDAWMDGVFKQMHTLSPGKVHVNGVDHSPFFQRHTFSPERLIAGQELVPIHCWPYWTGATKLGGPLDKPYTHMGASMAQLVRSYAGRADKPVWIQEFGACALEMPEKDLPRYMEIAVEAALEADVSWVTWWSSHDVGREFDFHPFEYGLGLVDQQHRIKAHGRTFRRLADQYRGRPVRLPTAAPAPPPAERSDEATWRWLMRDMAYTPRQGAAATQGG